MDPITARLLEEHRKWRQDTPEGFSAKPSKDCYGNMNLFTWECEVPGPRRTPCEGKFYKFRIEFDRYSLYNAPVIISTPRISHPNVYQMGNVCSSLRQIWPKCGLKQILFSLQTFLESPYRNGIIKPGTLLENLSSSAASGSGKDIEIISID